MGLTCDLIDLDVSPDRDLQVAREALEAARREGQEFAPSFDAVVSFFAEREVTSYEGHRQREHLLVSLRDLRDVWRAAYELADEPRPPKPQKLKTAPLNVDQIARFFWKPRIPKRQKPCRVCRRSFLPRFGHELVCGPECKRRLKEASRSRWRSRELERERAQRTARRQVPATA